jgi:chromosome condensin MukBEF complex kleisin-like MukF subunit
MVKNILSIPQIRDRLRELAAEHGIEELNDLANQMYRKSAKKRAPIRSQKLTPQMAVDIRKYAADNPDAHQQDIAELFMVNHGRVSEALDNQV